MSHIHKWVMSYVWVSHVILVNISCHSRARLLRSFHRPFRTYIWVISTNESRPQMSHVPCMSESHDTCEYFMSQQCTPSCTHWCEWVMSHVNESCHTSMSHVTHQWVMSHINECTPSCTFHRPFHTYILVISTDESRTQMSHVHKWVMSYVWMSHVILVNTSCHSSARPPILCAVTPVLSTGPSTLIYEYRAVYEWVTAHIWMNYEWVTAHIWMNYEWVTAHIWMNHIIMWHDSLIRVPWLLYFPLALPHLHTSAVPCMSESRHTYEWTMSMSHVTRQWVMSHINESRHTYEWTMSQKASSEDASCDMIHMSQQFVTCDMIHMSQQFVTCDMIHTRGAEASSEDKRMNIHSCVYLDIMPHVTVTWGINMWHDSLRCKLSSQENQDE